MEDAQDRLARVRAVLEKRKARVALCKRRQAYWRKKYEATGNERPLHKAAYWHEQLDKAVLGKKDYEKRERRLEKKVAYLKAHKPNMALAPGGISTPVAPWNPYRHPIANSIIPWLEKSWEAGWRGVVTSGWRDPDLCERLCYQICNAPRCPGRCAGRTSHHTESGDGKGAVDVSDYYTFAAVQRRIGSPLFNSLGAQDPVHFSFTGN